LAVSIVIAVASVVAANAADILGSRSVDGGDGVYSTFSARIEPLIVYDFEPGVIVRSCWYAPWQNRHYFPRTGQRPKVGRREHISAHGVSKAEDYFHYWSVSSVFAPDLSAVPARRFGIPPTPATPQSQ
jgi:hypothetical protein